MGVFPQLLLHSEIESTWEPITWEFTTGNSCNCVHTYEPQIHGKEDFMFWKDSNTFPHFQKVSVSATASETLSEHHCAVGHSTSESMRLSSLLPTEQNPRWRTWFFTNRAVSPGLCTSWVLGRGSGSVWTEPPQKKALLKAWPQLSVGPFKVDTNIQAT